MDALKVPDTKRMYVTDELNPIVQGLIVECICKTPSDPYPFMLDYLSAKKADEEDALLSDQERQRLEKENAELTIRVNKTRSQVHEATKMVNDFTDMKEVEDEEEDDDEDDELPPGWQKLTGNTARQSVSAEAYGDWNSKKVFVPPRINKDDSQIQRLKICLVKSFLFSSLEDQDLSIVIGAMQEVTVAARQQIINQGDTGDFLFVVESGKLDCVIKQPDGSEVCVKTCESGDVFGELALLYNCPRAASVLAKADCVLWQLDRNTFNYIVKDAAEKKRQRYDRFLSKVPLLSSMDASERSQLADALRIERFTNGSVIVSQGEIGKKFYILETGKAVAKKNGVEVMSYSSGDYFGELALINKAPRAATVTASCDAQLLSIDSGSFARLINVQDLLSKSSRYS
eukprot:TRINITY_DN9890_c0_g1_i1.p1 TRINITY_DN9890_c0_g1~~TRINITY_DN9890_c0_g1_i1.p1  ORF type:complete len:401 (+),score=93.13 TRINITY_DN9890_c0_g1_i1:163-1365(+)